MDIPVKIVLVNTSHPGNIGAAARAMKTMGLSELVLVNPERFPHTEATARASGADDLLARAQVVETVPDAIADCHYVVGASARLRSLPWPTENPRVCAEAIQNSIQSGGSAAVLFGPEQSGLINEDLARCHQLLNIPANPAYSSLNVAQAVQVVCYEIRMAMGYTGVTIERERRMATAQEMEGFHEHLRTILERSGFLNPEHPRQLLLRLRRLFNRAMLDENELNILRGILSAVDPARRQD